MSNPVGDITSGAPFWREAMLADAEQRLLDALYAAHAASVWRQNASSAALQNAAAASGSYTQSLAAALMTLGKVHAPIEQTVALLGALDPVSDVDVLLRQRRKVPGWGNSFHRGQTDPLWSEVAALLDVEFPEWSNLLGRITEHLHTCGKHLFPNPSAYTAASALALQIPGDIAAYLFIGGRLEGWTKLFMAARA